MLEKRHCIICGDIIWGYARKYCPICREKIRLKQINNFYHEHSEEWINKDGKYHKKKYQKGDKNKTN